MTTPPITPEERTEYFRDGVPERFRTRTFSNELAQMVSAYEAALSAAEARIERLWALLVELADDCEAEVENRYKGIKDHPVMTPRYERDMDTVRRARAALKGEMK